MRQVEPNQGKLRNANGANEKKDQGVLAPFAFCVLPFLSLAIGCDRKPAEDRVVMAWEAFPTNLDPRFAQDQASQRVLSLTHQGLLKRDANLAFVPDACTSWRWEQPFTELAFTFPAPSHGSRFTFTTGAPVSADDALDSLEALRDPALRSPKVGAYKEAIDALWIERRGAFDILRIRLRQPNPGFPSNLVRETFSIVPKGLRGIDAPGSGAYRITLREPEQRLVLSPRLDHPDFQGKSTPLALDLRWMPDATTRLLALRHGTAQAALNNLPADLLRPSERMIVSHRPGANLEYVAFNCDHPLLKDARVRRALALATDRAELVAGLLGGRGRAATAFYPPELPWGVDARADLGEGPDLQANREAAEGLLEAAGHPRNPHGLRFRLRLTTTPEVMARMKALALQAQWRKVGVELDLVSREFGTLLSEVMASKFEVVSLRWVGVTDPQMLMDTFHSTKIPPRGFNRGRFQNREVDRLLEAAQAAPDPASRWSLLREVQRKLMAQSPYIFLYWPDQVAVLAPGLAVDLNGAGDYTQIWRVQP